MNLDKTAYRILIIEDNPGDYYLVDDYLHEYILNPILLHIQTFAEARQLISPDKRDFDLILLDLTLPDIDKESLLVAAKEISQTIPIIILTGYADLNFATSSLSMGVSDFLLKDTINALILYKSILYAIQRDKFLNSLRISKKRYMELFHLSPAPMWVFDLNTLRFLDVNEAAIRHYGYSEDEFLSMALPKLFSLDDLPVLKGLLAKTRMLQSHQCKDTYRHLKKDGTVIQVETSGSKIDFNGIPAEIVLATDVTEKFNQMNAIQEQNNQLKEIAWLQSHILRAPVARLMGLVDLLKEDELEGPEHKEILNHLFNAATEIDEVINSIVKKSKSIRNNLHE
ncbi:PAS domain S-box-containing protein [Dyadobacter jejuensis]|uniref:PAS domain S-box-containing protein n=1 Tax=Dyadobacter jejuensis TaxID=1082580 RepID=A0A316ASH2_9BACT|nr:PAS domain S-box protein [Dyadobacter jejuensis]PWJ60259.1 PAS domain S-box-containing protein [Dyadobacter jejuensis]